MKYTITKPISIHEMGKRENQEDSIFPKHGEASSRDRLFIVCDGMGGHDNGEVASGVVCNTMSNFLEANIGDGSFSDNLFQTALSATYNALDSVDRGGATKKMGTTIALVKLHNNGCYMAHIGDSRIYHIRPSTGEIIYKSRDHSLVNDLYDIGEITLEQIKTSTQKNIITRVMQPHQTRRANADIKDIKDIKAGDYIFVCSDGMLEDLEDNNLVNILSLDNSYEEKVRILIDVTERNKDNRSAYLIHIIGVIE